MNTAINHYQSYPDAQCLLEALRGMDYTPASAIADLIDNSISANATEVHLLFLPQNDRNPKPIVVIADNGAGMTSDELLKAMRLGGINPRNTRDITDLGRFGLGLKTASFSQCRRLTVYSRKNKKSSCFCWDLDYIANNKENGGWNILDGRIPSHPEIKKLISGMKHGTVVIWEELDRFLPEGISEENFIEAIKSVELYLRLYFHRFLQSTAQRLKIFVNGRSIKALDPFMETNSRTSKSPEQKLGSNEDSVSFCGFILPHKDKLTSDQYIEGGCINGWVSHEGFYIYRNERLLLPGSWLGLGRHSHDKKRWIQDELHQLVRIRLDITNRCDENWKIDIRKSSASPPLSIQKELTRLAERLREQARKVYVFRGGYKPRQEMEDYSYVWVPMENQQGKIRYRINTEHPLITSLLQKSGNLSSDIQSLFRILEDTVPVQKIWLDSAEGKNIGTFPEQDSTGSNTQQYKQILEIIQSMLDIGNKTILEIQLILLQTPPFNLYETLIKKACNELIKQKK